MSEKLNHRYSEKEEFLNVLSHGFGLVLSLIAFPFLILKALNYNGFWKPISFIIYGFSLILLYAASTFYHAAKKNLPFIYNTSSSDAPSRQRKNVMITRIFLIQKKVPTA